MGSSSSDLAALDDELIEAAADDDVDVLLSALDKGANVNHITKDEADADPGGVHAGMTPLMVAVQENSLACVKALCATRHVEVHRADTFGFTPCHVAAHWDRAACLGALLEAGADATRRAKGGLTAAHVAAARDNLAVLRVLRSALGAAVADLRDDHNKSPYDTAVESGSQDCVALLEHGASPRGVVV